MPACISLLIAVNTGKSFDPSVPVLFGEAAMLLSADADSGEIGADSLTSAGLTAFAANVESFLEKSAFCKAARDSINNEKPAHDISTR